MNYKELNPQELIRRCVDTGESEAWQEFVRRFQPLISGVVARAAMRWTEASPALVDDLVQETYLKLCTEEFRRLRQFESHHEDAIFGFLKTVAYNVTLDYFKTRYASKRGARLQSHTDFDTTLQVAGQETPVEDKVLLNEIEDLVRQFTDTERDRTVFSLYYRQGFTSKAIAAIPGIDLTEKGVESCLHRLTRQLREHVGGARKMARRDSAGFVIL